MCGVVMLMAAKVTGSTSKDEDYGGNGGGRVWVEVADADGGGSIVKENDDLETCYKLAAAVLSFGLPHDAVSELAQELVMSGFSNIQDGDSEGDPILATSLLEASNLLGGSMI